ncbi:protease-4 [Formivibrio citricus]|uniref:Protease-4 n=1 Tax=Formivibrio citricus TaxID=83765 RepID=A0A1I4UZZ7_9NEIS|nr:S49 family peptidase [Formivibrio citricus]SFM94599.1 protease-4 [Formivibrio citricus]
MNDEAQRQVLAEVLTANLKEQRSARRWGIFFKSLTFLWLFSLLVMLGLSDKGTDAKGGPHTALVNLEGTIAAGGDVDGGRILESLRAAFEDKNTKAVILRANSPGGSPVQAGIINDEIRRLRHKYPDVPLYAVIGDICASGCYYVAAAADRIYADKASIVGSIGVLMDGFGFTGTMEKFGIERRLVTAGSNKGFLDPFSPLKPEQRQKAQVMLNEVHQQFIDVVKAGRGDRLVNSPELFSGLVWSGATAKKMGLVDDLGSVDGVAREVVKVEEIVDFTSKPSWTDRVARQIGAAAADRISAKLDIQLR